MSVSSVKRLHRVFRWAINGHAFTPLGYTRRLSAIRVDMSMFADTIRWYVVVRSLVTRAACLVRRCPVVGNDGQLTLHIYVNRVLTAGEKEE
jgi:hypothetical protein